MPISQQASFSGFDLGFDTGGDVPPVSASLLQSPDMSWYPPEPSDGQSSFAAMPESASTTAWGSWTDYPPNLSFDGVSGSMASASLYDTTMGSY